MKKVILIIIVAVIAWVVWDYYQQGHSSFLPESLTRRLTVPARPGADQPDRDSSRSQDEDPATIHRESLRAIANRLNAPIRTSTPDQRERILAIREQIEDDVERGRIPPDQAAAGRRLAGHLQGLNTQRRQYEEAYASTLNRPTRSVSSQERAEQLRDIMLQQVEHNWQEALARYRPAIETELRHMQR